jgi:probable phosphoglycerate mutase
MELVLIRHGLPQRVETGDGSPADPSLSDLGKQQANCMADLLGKEQFHRLYASPMKRAYETAVPLASASGLTVDLEDGIAEFDQESASYIPMEELKQVDYARWRSLMEDGYDDPQAFGTFCDRVITSMERIVAENSGKKVAIVCHGGVINVWTSHVIGFPPRLFFNPDYTSINRFMAAGSGERSVISLNDANHLRGRF